jgi:hypothetical protein
MQIEKRKSSNEINLINQLSSNSNTKNEIEKINEANNKNPQEPSNNASKLKENLNVTDVKENIIQTSTSPQNVFQMNETKKADINVNDNKIILDNANQKEENVGLLGINQSSNKPIENNISHNITKPQGEEIKKKSIPFKEAMLQIDKFSDLINNLEIEIKEKYGINIPQFYYEDILPDGVKLKMIEEYFNDKDIIELSKQAQQNIDEKK